MWNALQAGQLDFERTLAIFQPLITFGVSYVETAQRAGEVSRHVDVPVVLPLVFGMFIYTFIAQPGQRRHFGADVADAKFGARARAALLDSVDRMLGFAPPVRPARRSRRASRAPSRR
jgi:hypothetical protein